MSADRIQTYSEFWPYYVREHAHPVNRAMHFVGTTLALGFLAYAVASARWWLIPVCLVLGYGPAWIGHFTIEKNRPATFKYPLWSLISDFRMWGMIVTGRMGAEVERAMSRVK